MSILGITIIFDLDHDFHEIFYMADHKQFI